MLTYSAQGTGVAFVAPRAVLLIDLDLQRASTFWDTFASGSTSIEEILSILTQDGINQVPDFAYAELVDPIRGSVTVAVRGSGTASIGDTTYEGVGAMTWVEASGKHVTSLTLSLATASGEAAPADPVMLPIEHGVVQTGNIIWGNEEPDILTETMTQRSPMQEVFTLPAPGAHAEEPVEESTVVKRTIPSWMLRFTTGQVIGVGGRVVVGRRPTPTIVAGEQLEQLLSPQREVSANHALLIGESDGVRLIDLDSKNGSIVRDADGASALVTDGAEMLLEEGVTVDFGDGNQAEVVRASTHDL